MFFTDPVAAFTNIGRALRPGARVALMVWQNPERNEWYSAIRRSLAVGTAQPSPAAGRPEFSLSDPASVEGILAAAGFVDVGFIDVDEPVYYGQDSDTAYDFVRSLRLTKDLLADLDATMTEHALKRLRATLAAQRTGSGVFFDSRAWIIMARCH